MGGAMGLVPPVLERRQTTSSAPQTPVAQSVRRRLNLEESPVARFERREPSEQEKTSAQTYPELPVEPMPEYTTPPQSIRSAASEPPLLRPRRRRPESPSGSRTRRRIQSQSELAPPSIISPTSTASTASTTSTAPVLLRIPHDPEIKYRVSRQILEKARQGREYDPGVLSRAFSTVSMRDARVGVSASYPTRESAPPLISQEELAERIRRSQYPSREFQQVSTIMSARSSGVSPIGEQVSSFQEEYEPFPEQKRRQELQEYKDQGGELTEELQKELDDLNKRAHYLTESEPVKQLD